MLLNCHTYFSICYGTLSLNDLMREVKDNGYDTFVLTDINNTSACIDAVRSAAEEFNLQPILGIDFRNGIQQQYVGIAKNNLGFKELNEHLTEHLHGNQNFPQIAPEFEHAYVIYPMNKYTGWKLKEHEFIGVSIKDLQKLPFTPAKHHPNKLVALQPVSFSNKQHFN